MLFLNSSRFHQTRILHWPNVFEDLAVSLSEIPQEEKFFISFSTILNFSPRKTLWTELILWKKYYITANLSSFPLVRYTAPEIASLQCFSAIFNFNWCIKNRPVSLALQFSLCQRLNLASLINGLWKPCLKKRELWWQMPHNLSALNNEDAANWGRVAHGDISVIFSLFIKLTTLQPAQRCVLYMKIF